MIDLSRKYRTRNGHDVVLHERRPYNGVGEKASFPIKGTIIRKPLRPLYMIWTDEGKGSLLKEHPHDLIEVTE